MWFTLIIYFTCDIFSFKGGLGGIPIFYMCFVTLPPKNSKFFYPKHKGKKRYSHMKICVKGFGVNSKGTSHLVRCAYVPNQLLYGDKKEINNKCAILILYIIINKYMLKKYSFKIISAFSEGLNIHGGNNGFAVLTESEMKSNGYELVRQLTQEFSLRSRAEALNLRTSLASKSFSLSASETTVGTVVSDTIRKLDYECSRYTRLVSTLPSTVDSTGLMLPEADMLMILLRSLPPNS